MAVQECRSELGGIWRGESARKYSRVCSQLVRTKQGRNWRHQVKKNRPSLDKFRECLSWNHIQQTLLKTNTASSEVCFLTFGSLLSKRCLRSKQNFPSCVDRVLIRLRVLSLSYKYSTLKE